MALHITRIVLFVISIIWSFGINTITVLKKVDAHGYMHTPVPRSRVWRYYSNIKPYYNDNGINCAQPAYVYSLSLDSNHYNLNCTECGIYEFNTCLSPDAIQSPLISAGLTLNQIPSTTKLMSIVVHLTTNHLGHFIFEVAKRHHEIDGSCDPSIAPHIEHSYVPIDSHTPVIPDKNEYVIDVNVESIPKECRFGQPCVLRWTYIGGNNWGCNGNKTYPECGMGYGKQMVFRNCADFIIL